MELGPDGLSLAPSLQLHGAVLSAHPSFLPHCFPLSLLSSLGAGLVPGQVGAVPPPNPSLRLCLCLWPGQCQVGPPSSGKW